MTANLSDRGTNKPLKGGLSELCNFKLCLILEYSNDRTIFSNLGFSLCTTRGLFNWWTVPFCLIWFVVYCPAFSASLKVSLVLEINQSLQLVYWCYIKIKVCVYRTELWNRMVLLQIWFILILTNIYNWHLLWLSAGGKWWYIYSVKIPEKYRKKDGLVSGSVVIWSVCFINKYKKGMRVTRRIWCIGQ